MYLLGTHRKFTPTVVIESFQTLSEKSSSYRTVYSVGSKSGNMIFFFKSNLVGKPHYIGFSQQSQMEQV